jgi:hypothetical protein
MLALFREHASWIIEHADDGMNRHHKLLHHILTKRGDANVPFDGLRRLLGRLGFDERIRGDHHIFSKKGLDEIINIQPKGDNAKPYQVKQVRAVVLRYGLKIEE